MKKYALLLLISVGVIALSCSKEQIEDYTQNHKTKDDFSLQVTIIGVTSYDSNGWNLNLTYQATVTKGKKIDHYNFYNGDTVSPSNYLGTEKSSNGVAVHTSTLTHMPSGMNYITAVAYDKQGNVLQIKTASYPLT